MKRRVNAHYTGLARRSDLPALPQPFAGKYKWRLRSKLFSARVANPVIGVDSRI